MLETMLPDVKPPCGIGTVLSEIYFVGLYKGLEASPGPIDLGRYSRQCSPVFQLVFRIYLGFCITSEARFWYNLSLPSAPASQSARAKGLPIRSSQRHESMHHQHISSFHLINPWLIKLHFLLKRKVLPPTPPLHSLDGWLSFNLIVNSNYLRNACTPHAGSLSAGTTVSLWYKNA